MEMSYNSTGENEFNSPQNLTVPGASSPVENSLKEPCNTPLSNDTLYSNTNSPSDSCVKPLCNAASEKKSNKGVKYVSSEGDKLECGWGAFTPACLQFFNTPKGVLLFLCVASFLQGMIVNGFINTVITSIERRFDLHSYQSGLIASSYDIAACVCLMFVSYFGGNGHKPRWLGWGVLIMGVGSIVFALPHFTTSPSEVHFSEETGICSSHQSMPCAESVSILSNYRFVFMLGQFLHGIGATPLYTLGVTYLDENVKSNYSPVYIAIFYTAAILGPAAGYLVGGMFLNIYSEIGKQVDLTPDNTLWVGAWWIGFLGAGAAALLTAIPILGYPRRLPGSQRYIIMRVSEAHQLKDGSQETASDPDFGKTVKDLPRSLLLLLKNPTFIFLCLAGATEATLIAGMSTFGPKFLESQYSLSASEAATLFGYLVVPAGGGGTFLGGFIVNKFKLRCSGIIKLCLLCTVTSLLPVFIFFIHCPNMPMAGVTQMYDRSILLESSLNLTAACNTECDCLREIYSPVCGSDDIMYYSACHAGCKKISILDSGKKVYHECSCILENDPTGSAQAIAGKCTSSCERRTVLLVFMFFVIFFTFLCSIPALTATLRCVSDRQRSFALGIQWIVVRTLGGIPGPIAFGSVIDLSCLVWQDQCGEQGSCYVYQNSAMSRYTLIAGIVYKVMPSSWNSLLPAGLFPLQTASPRIPTRKLRCIGKWELCPPGEHISPDPSC
ncbi:solute carrier organic anion transporter family member 4A1 isoform X1 [Gopherus flavomarginatus]|uniref:solute carrier organic anion transporter family member 4A1 isoform X1 n=1 Tax=Gopherus flavomarginatus TaxID=286002 RepID=UPI0021CBA20B|nr:solute carrier organic anion transporter family member 4A1 isoform X1 [Gopherus flavomarginatus]XP_050774628.1 solute carrier organic anion transporter family member 4A1 isoform X1 [Gopherus flavomarginatus]XP_050774629.1 solute carrier organic anion transporter family member 4A1 isoform X1 [Gopherus flavomarginatus]